MIAVSTLPTGSTPDDHVASDIDWRHDFDDLFPRLRRQLRAAFRRLDEEAREEAVQESACLACRAYARLAVDGHTGVATAASLAGYAAAQYRAGRRAAAPLNVNDVCSEHCRLRRGVKVERLGAAVSDGWREALVEDRTITRADLAASRIDYPAFVASLPPTARRVAEALAGGDSTGEAATCVGLSSGRVSQLRRELLLAWRRFHGEPDARPLVLGAA